MFKNLFICISILALPFNTFGETFPTQHLPLLKFRLAEEVIGQASPPSEKDVARLLNGLSGLAKESYLSPLFEKIAIGIFNKQPALADTLYTDKWLLHLGLALEANNQSDLASKFYSRITPKDASYLASRYFLALIFHQQNKLDQAEQIIHSIPAPVLSTAIDNPILDHLKLLQARLAFEKKNYDQSIRAYRQIAKTSPIYFTALKEQVWPLFKAQHIRHALGIIYSAQSPFFKDKYAPELDLLKSILHYSICRYDDARLALAEFSSQYTPIKNEIQGYLQQNSQNFAHAYEVYENYTHGVGAKTLGLSNTLLQELVAAPDIQEQNKMLSVATAELASLYDLRSRFGEVMFTKHKTFLDSYTNQIRQNIGQSVINLWREKSAQLDKLFSQAKLLHLEILMSQKEQLLGSELHGEIKVANLQADLSSLVRQRRHAQTWAEDKKQEYWWDEIGNHVSALPDQCLKK